MTEQCPICLNPVQPGAESCPVCGFKLMGATQRFAPVSLGERSERSTGGSSRASLKVVRGLQAGASYPLSAEAMTIGRSPQCDIFLNDMTVSRMHAVIEKEGSSFIIRDQNSYNGLWVNDLSVESKTLRDGDQIQVGSFTLEYQEQ